MKKEYTAGDWYDDKLKEADELRKLLKEAIENRADDKIIRSIKKRLELAEYVGD